MIRLATVLAVHVDPVAAAPLLDRLEAAGCTVVLAGNNALDIARSDHPDLILVGEAAGDPVAPAARFKTAFETADIPVVALTDTVGPGLAERALAAGLDDVLNTDADDPELLARLRPLIRLATMHAELRHRALAAAELGVAVPDRAPPPGSNQPRVLVAGPDSDGAAALLRAIADVTDVTDLYEAERLLERHHFDAAIIGDGGDSEAELAFATQVRHNPRLFNLPIVMISDDQSLATRFHRRGGSRVLERPLDPGMLRATVLTLVRRQQLRWAIRGLLGRSLCEITSDPLTGAYNRPFIDRYLSERLEDARARARPLTLVLFAFPNLDGVRTHFGDEAARNLLRQLGQWISGLVRAEDPVALWSDDRFCVALPDTLLTEAQVVMHRIAGVLTNTDFAVPEVYQPIRVWVQVGCADASPDDDCASLYARAAIALDEDSCPACGGQR